MCTSLLSSKGLSNSMQQDTTRSSLGGLLQLALRNRCELNLASYNLSMLQLICISGRTLRDNLDCLSGKA